MGASLTITQGIVNNPDYDFYGNHYILTDTTINPGNSGGPMYDEEGYVIGTAVAKSIIKNVSNQNFILSMGQLSAFLSASGIDIKYGPYPYYAKSVTVSGFPSYSAPPSNPIPSNPIPSTPSAPPSGGNPFGGSPFGGNPFGGGQFGGSPSMLPPTNPFAMMYPIGGFFSMPGPIGFPMGMIVSAHVQCGGNTYIVFRVQQMQGYYLYTLMPNGALMPVMDQNLTAYVVNYCASVGALRY